MLVSLKVCDTCVLTFKSVSEVAEVAEFGCNAHLSALLATARLTFSGTRIRSVLSPKVVALRD